MWSHTASASWPPSSKSAIYYQHPPFPAGSGAGPASAEHLAQLHPVRQPAHKVGCGFWICAAPWGCNLKKDSGDEAGPGEGGGHHGAAGRGGQRSQRMPHSSAVQQENTSHAQSLQVLSPTACTSQLCLWHVELVLSAWLVCTAYQCGGLHPALYSSCMTSERVFLRGVDLHAQ